MIRSMMLMVSLIVLAGCAGSSAQDPESTGDVSMPYESYAAMREALFDAANLEDTAASAAALDDIFAALEEADRIPYASGDSVAFLYRGPAESVSFPGDFNGWNPEATGALRVGWSDVWIQEDFFPEDARLDYKIVADGVWGLDPRNTRIQRSGFGDNSELRMPGYVASRWVDRREDVPTGDLTPDTLESERLGFTVALQIYTPPGFEGLDDLPVMYVTDGHEYADDRLGAMVPVMDNLIAAGKLRPMIAVFIDMRVAGANRRHDLLVMNRDFVAFVVDELVPMIDMLLPTSTDRTDRGMLGTSLGGLNSMWFGYAAHETFGRIAIQSPAFQAGEGRIVGLLEESPPLDVDLYLTYGTFNDFGEHTERVLKILDAKGYDYGLKIVNEGHSWGNWRALLDEILLRFWPAE